VCPESEKYSLKRTGELEPTVLKKMRRFIKMSRFATVLLVLFMLLILRVSVDASTGFDDAEEEEKEGVQMETDESSMFSADTKVLRLSPKNFRGITDGIRHPNVKMDPETMSKAEKAKLDIMMKDAKDPSKARTNPNAIGLLVLFYTEWCGHCQELVPIFDQASKEIDYYAKAEGEGNPMTRVHLVAVDASGDEASKALHEEYGISQFPTLQWWRGGFFSDEYSGKLPVTESTELVDWVIFRMTSTTTGAEDIPTAKDGRQFIEDTNQRGETAVIGFLDEPQEFGSHFAHKSFQRCASHRIGVPHATHLRQTTSQPSRSTDRWKLTTGNSVMLSFLFFNVNQVPRGRGQTPRRRRYWGSRRKSWAQARRDGQGTVRNGLPEHR